ncbi:MAG: peptidoglycan-binding protein [Verrucomicrobiales bacterium]
MKTLPRPLVQIIGAVSLLFAGLVALPQEARADRFRSSSYGGHSSHNQSSYGHSSRYRGGHNRPYSGYRPSSGFSISFGSGNYYGRSYSPYYSGRSYYSEPSYRSYDDRSGYSARGQNASVQRALARHGYYNGSIDGVIGSQSRRAIANYQQDRGMRATGTITSDLLRSLGV